MIHAYARMRLVSFWKTHDIIDRARETRKKLKKCGRGMRKKRGNVNGEACKIHQKKDIDKFMHYNLCCDFLAKLECSAFFFFQGCFRYD